MTRDQERANLELGQAIARFVATIEATAEAAAELDKAMARCREVNVIDRR
jgi:hypothetical protein